MKQRLTNSSRLLLLVAAAGLVFVLFTPIWSIDLTAPQYPEGLGLTIHANGLKGNVDIINGLNHYIGMKTLHNEDFIEFKVLPYCIIFFVAAFVLVALRNRRRWLNIIFILFVVFGIVAIADFWRWEYNYGHNLDPNAAIVVPGMAYQPPLLGFKQLLNFGAYSFPATGGWLFIGAGISLIFCLLLEWRKNHGKKIKHGLAGTAVFLLISGTLSSCQSGPEAIVAGKDNCYLCKMGISDSKYAAELVTQKGKVYKFDDIRCLLDFTKSGSIAPAAIKEIYLADFAGTHSLVKATACSLLQGGNIRGPMNGNIIAFKNKDSMQKLLPGLKADAVSWQQVNK